MADDVALGLVLAAGIVLGIDVVELGWGGAVDLDDDFAIGHGVVVHVGVEISKAASGESGHLGFVKAIAHADLESSGNDGDVFAMRMPMGRDAIAVRHLQTDREVTGGS